jgi:hypothetical protein
MPARRRRNLTMASRFNGSSASLDHRQDQRQLPKARLSTAPSTLPHTSPIGGSTLMVR